MKLFTWIKGRQEGTEYQKFCFLYFKIFKLGLDGYILKYEPNTILKPHRDVIDGKHYRLNIELAGEGEFECESEIINIMNKIHLFRPDINIHSVINKNSKRYVLSLGLAIFNK